MSKKKQSKSDGTPLTMTELAEKYIAHLRDVGRGLGTQFSYSLDLQMAVRHFGDTTEVTTLTPESILAFNDSDAVTKTKSGRPKAKVGIDKTKRVLRLALRWAAESGLIPEAPVHVAAAS